MVRWKCSRLEGELSCCWLLVFSSFWWKRDAYTCLGGWNGLGKRDEPLLGIQNTAKRIHTKQISLHIRTDWVGIVRAANTTLRIVVENLVSVPKSKASSEQLCHVSKLSTACRSTMGQGRGCNGLGNDGRGDGGWRRKRSKDEKLKMWTHSWRVSIGAWI